MRFLVSGVKHLTASNDDNIPSRFDLGEQGLECSSDEAFCPISFDSFPHRTTCDNSNARPFQVIGKVDQHDKRVRIRLSQLSHPLEIG